MSSEFVDDDGMVVRVDWGGRHSGHPDFGTDFHLPRPLRRIYWRRLAGMLIADLAWVTFLDVAVMDAGTRLAFIVIGGALIGYWCPSIWRPSR